MTSDPSTPPTQGPGAEFDDYASGYDAGMDGPIKSLLGDSADEFVAVKVQWLLRNILGTRPSSQPIRILDYGCGTATLLRLLVSKASNASLSGCDISAGMLAHAKTVWPQSAPKPDLHLQQGAATGLPGSSFDLIVISAVLHHVPLDERAGVYAEIKRLLRPGGKIVVFEHNPFNPVTRYVVARTPIDKNAILLTPNEVVGSLTKLSFGQVKTKYLMFSPPKYRSLVAVEHWLDWLPMGAQYAVVATRGAA